MSKRLPVLVLLLLLLSSQAMAATESLFRIHIITSEFVLPSKLTMLSDWAEQADMSLHGFYVEQISPQSDWLNADLIILDTPRGGDRAKVMAAMKSMLNNVSVPWLAVGGGPPLSANLSPAVMRQLIGYYDAGGKTNFVNMFAYIHAWHQQQPLGEIATPQLMPESGIYHPDAEQLFSDWTAYQAWGNQRWQSDASVLAVAMSSTFISNSQTRFYDALIKRTEQAGAIPLVFWFDRHSDTGLQKMIAAANPVMLLNTTHMVSGKQRQAEFKQLNVPVTVGLTARDHDRDGWKQAKQGIPASSAATMMVIPESWGMTDPLVLAAIEEGEPVAMAEQLDLLIGRFKALATLRQQPVEQNRLALMFWNSPAGEKNLSASNLNVAQSIEKLTQSLAAEGYTLPVLTEAQVISTAQQMLSAYYRPTQLMTLWQQKKAVTLPLKHYQQWLSSLPEAIQAQLNEHWGAAADNWAIRQIDNQPQFVIPALQTDHFIWMPQPPRADKLGKNTHDLNQPPGHLYLAAYLYLREQFAANALIHLGTHGTQEWTPGKDRGLWAYDYPNLAVGNMPVFYPYIQDNIGEAIQAKRRGRATIISHQTPPYSPSGLYDELQQIHDLMHQYLQLDAGGVRQQTQQQMLTLVTRFNLHTDLGWTENDMAQRFDEFLPQLHDHLHQLAQATTPIGLHTFGEPAAQNLRIATVMQQLGEPYYHALGVDANELYAQPFETLFEQAPFTFLAAYIRGEKSIANIENETLREMMEQAKISENKLADDGEMQALLQALRGGFVKPGLGGDPIRQPNTTSGTNLYAFDPEKLPSKAAYNASQGLYQSLIADYREHHEGAYPDKLAFTLWSSEAIRTYGLVESQILRALGVRPEWDAAGKVTGFSIIPEAELSQPRVDVVLQITSVYRDQFDGLMRKLATVIEQLAQDDPARHVIARNRARIEQQLLANGLSAEKAARFAGARMFSNPPGDYGSGVTDVAMDSTSWEDDSILADTFIQSQSHIYTSQDWGIAVEEIKLLQSQLQGTDAVVLSRSSNLHGLLSTDHPFEYLGGLSAVIKQVDGQHPQLYVADSRKQQPTITAASEFISTELRSRYQNPQWIQSMQQEGYAGTVEMLKIVNNVFGWQVVDPSMIRADQWQALHDTYVMDQRELGLNDWFAEHNPTAQAQMIERMMEAVRKGYWRASGTTRQQLATRWQELVTELGADRGADKTVGYIEQQLAGFGLDAPAATPVAGEAQPVAGQILQQQPAAEQTKPDWLWLLLMVLALVIAGGGRRIYYYQHWKSS